jgi:hypothetical protein
LDRVLSQMDGQCNRDISGVDDEFDFDLKSDGCDWFPRRVTVREVLKYSLTWVIIPSVTVQACTQEMERLVLHPSTTTRFPKEVMEIGEKSNGTSLSFCSPVRRRIINW